MGSNPTLDIYSTRKMKQRDLDLIELRLTSIENTLKDFKTEISNKLDALNKYYSKVLTDELVNESDELKYLRKLSERLDKWKLELDKKGKTDAINKTKGNVKHTKTG